LHCLCAVPQFWMRYLVITSSWLLGTATESSCWSWCPEYCWRILVRLWKLCSILTRLWVSQGYRVIAADAPPVWTHQEWVSSFEKFLDALGVHHVRILLLHCACFFVKWKLKRLVLFFRILRMPSCSSVHLILSGFVLFIRGVHSESLLWFCSWFWQVHLYGTSLGGFLVQMFAQHRPRRVKSLLLSNTYVDNHTFQASMSWSALWVFCPLPSAPGLLCSIWGIRKCLCNFCWTSLRFWQFKYQEFRSCFWIFMLV
jgi:hypothetical protein